MLVRSRRIRALGRSVPGLPYAYYLLNKWYVLHRAVADLDWPGARIRIRVDSEEILHLRLRPVAKEPWTVQWIEQQLRAGDVLYDIGANVGGYALIAGKHGGSDVTVVAVEPGYASYAALCNNIVLNGLGASVLALPVVLGEATRLGSLSYRDLSAGAAMHELDAAGSGAYRQPVLVFALDDLVEQFELPAPTLVKLDVDGAESAVLAGARRTLVRPELRSLIVEVDNDQTEAVLGETERAGFSLTRRIDERYGEPLPNLWYGIFERR